MENKICIKCCLDKPITEFYLNRKSLKPKGTCIICEKEYAKKYRETNKVKISERVKEWSVNNRDKRRISNYNWRDNNPEKVRVTKNNYNKNRKIIDNLFKLKINLRTMINNSFRKRNLFKNSKTNDILGCSYEEFKNYLESKFESWMNWNNHGKYDGSFNSGWDVDHIVPISNAKTEDDVIRLNHYTNLQPLCSKINRDIKKSN